MYQIEKYAFGRYAQALCACFAAGVALLFLGACDNQTPVERARDGLVPNQVENVQVENTPGGAIITYDLPDENPPLYVEATFDIGNGTRRQATSSSYENRLVVEGFPEEAEYTGELVAVSRGGGESDPLPVTIDPEMPPIRSVIETVRVSEAFGGARIEFQNPTETDLVFSVVTPDTTGENDMMIARDYYTSRAQGEFFVRGFDPEEREFAVYAKDRWDFYSDTTRSVITPLYEEEIANKNEWNLIELPNDNSEPHPTCCTEGQQNLWDGRTNLWGPVFHTSSVGMPVVFTIDLGVRARLNRFKIWHRAGAGDGPYVAGDPENFEVWGSNDPAVNGSWDSWTKLGDFTSQKPSGDGPVTQEDVQFAVVDGEPFLIPGALDNPPYRYIRVRITKVFGNAQGAYWAEMSLWGQIVEEDVEGEG